MLLRSSTASIVPVPSSCRLISTRSPIAAMSDEWASSISLPRSRQTTMSPCSSSTQKKPLCSFTTRPDCVWLKQPSSIPTYLSSGTILQLFTLFRFFIPVYGRLLRVFTEWSNQELMMNGVCVTGPMWYDSVTRTMDALSLSSHEVRLSGRAHFAERSAARIGSPYKFQLCHYRHQLSTPRYCHWRCRLRPFYSEQRCSGRTVRRTGTGQRWDHSGSARTLDCQRACRADGRAAAAGPQPGRTL